MPPKVRPPHKVQTQFFAALRASAAEYKGSAFGAHLRAAGMGDASRVSRFEGGERHLRFDELDALLDHLGNDAVHALDILAARHGCVVVADESAGEGQSSIELHALRISKLIGDLAGEIAEASAPDSDGGADITDAEAARLRPLLRQIVRMATEVEQALPSPGLRSA